VRVARRKSPKSSAKRDARRGHRELATIQRLSTALDYLNSKVRALHFEDFGVYAGLHPANIKNKSDVFSCTTKLWYAKTL
jgi:hypothetical protein